MPDPNDPRVFISYSRQDGYEFAQKLRMLLIERGLLLYHDINDLQGNLGDWGRQIEAAIKAVEHVVLILTPKALESPHVRDEWKLARQEGRKVSPVSVPASSISRICRAGWRARIATTSTIPESRARLVQVLKGPAGEKRVPFMADALPEGFVARPRSSTG